jgi:uncharacterized membrane protein YhaH (DUF805 family)
MDDLVKAVKTCLNKYADFKGRAARPEFWWFALATFVVSAVLNQVIPMLGALFSLAVLLPSLAVAARRLHDIGKSGWFLLLLLIPVIGWLVLLYFYIQPSGPSNEFGEAQAAPSMVPATPGQQ